MVVRDKIVGIVFHLINRYHATLEMCSMSYNKTLNLQVHKVEYGISCRRCPASAVSWRPTCTRARYSARTRSPTSASRLRSTSPARPLSDTCASGLRARYMYIFPDAFKKNMYSKGACTAPHALCSFPTRYCLYFTTGLMSTLLTVVVIYNKRELNLFNFHLVWKCSYPNILSRSEVELHLFRK